MSPRAPANACPRWLALALLAAAGVVLFVVALPRASDPQLDPAEVDPQFLLAAAHALTPPDNGQPLTERELVEAFEALGPSSLRAALALICGCVALPELEPPAEGDPPPHPDATRLRDGALRAVVTRAEPGAVLGQAVSLSHNASIDVRRVLFQLLASVDHPDALATLVQCADGVEPIHWRRDYIARSFTTAVQARIAAHPHALRVLRGRLRDVDDALCAVLAGAAAGAPTKLGVEFAVDLLGRDDEADLAVLQALARAPRRSTLACDESSLAAVRQRLVSGDARVRRAAIDVCGRLADADALDELTGELESDDAVIAHAARTALKAISGVDQGPTRQAWARWLAAEQDWREREWESLVAQLNGEDRGQSLAAMRALVSHPLHRRSAADAIVAALSTGAELGPQEASVLAATASPAAIEPLLEGLESEDEALVRASQAALAQLTGLNAEPQREAWTAVLGQ